MNAMDVKTKIMGDGFYLQQQTATFKLANELFDITVAHREYLKKWLNWAYENVTKSPEDSYAYLQKNHQAWQAGKKFNYFIRLSDTDEIIGCTGTVQLGKNNVEFGTWISPKHAGHGYGSRAKQLLQDEFSALGIERFVMKIDAGNITSQNGARRMGYEMEGTERHAYWTESFGEYRDMTIWSKIILNGK